MSRTVSVNTAELLRDSGFPQKGNMNIFKRDGQWICIFRPDTEGLLDELPAYITRNGFIHDLTIRKDKDGYFNVHYGTVILQTQVGLPETLASMWFWLKKEKLL